MFSEEMRADTTGADTTGDDTTGVDMGFPFLAYGAGALEAEFWAMSLLCAFEDN